MTCSTILIDDLADLRQRRSMKWDSGPDDVRPLWVAEMDCVLAEPIRHALATAVARSDTGYAHRTGRTSAAYAESFAGFADRRWGWSVDPTHAALMPDVMQGATHALRALTAPDSPVVLTPPVYPPFFHHVAVDLGRPIVDVPLRADPAGRYRLDLDGIDAAFAAGAGGLLLCNPHNPTGTVFPAAELAALAAIAARRGARVVVDEIHAPLVLGDRPFTPYLTVDPTAIAVHSGSKAFNLAGLKAALAVAGPDAIDELARVPDPVSIGAGLFGVLAGEAAYRHGDEWLARLLAELRANQDLLADVARRAAARGALDPPGRDLPGLARPPRPGAGQRSGRGAAGTLAGRALPRTRLRPRRRGLRPAQPGHRPDAADRGRVAPVRARQCCAA